jgi:hypothetical protein
MRPGSIRQQQLRSVKRSSEPWILGKGQAAETTSPSLYLIKVVDDTWTSSTSMIVGARRENTEVIGTMSLRLIPDPTSHHHRMSIIRRAKLGARRDSLSATSYIGAT